MNSPYDVNKDPMFSKFFKQLLTNEAMMKGVSETEQSERNKALDEAIHVVMERKVFEGSHGLISKEITIQAIERLKDGN